MQSAIVLLVVVLSLAAICHAERLKCKMVPFETKEGLTGTCCVFFKNSSDVTLPKEEIAQQILSNEQKDQASSTEAAVKVSDVPVKKRLHDGEKVYFPENDKPSGNNSKPVINKEQNKNITTNNRNAFDTPAVCPEGTLKDHNGDCTEPF